MDELELEAPKLNGGEGRKARERARPSSTGVLSRTTYLHGKRERTYMSIQRSGNLSPRLSKILLSVFREQDGEGGFLGESSSRVVVGGEGLDLPL